MRRIGLFLILVVVSAASFAQDDIRSKNFNVRSNLAIEGYDPVSYFDNLPAEGKPNFENIYKGIKYRFTNSSNLEKFKAAPERYEPAYGGWCAYAMGESGEKVKIDPATYKILDGKLYLFYNFWGTNTLTKWDKNEKPLKTRGDENWKKFVQ